MMAMTRRRDDGHDKPQDTWPKYNKKHWKANCSYVHDMTWAHPEVCSAMDFLWGKSTDPQQ